MRSFMILLISICLVVVIVLAVIIFSPEPGKSQKTFNKISMNQQPQPVLQSDPGADYILDFFPDPKDIMPTPSESDSIEVQQNNEVSSATANDTKQLSSELDRNTLLSLIMDWSYVDFSRIVEKKSGRIHQQRQNSILSVFEGMVLDNGIEIAKLTSDAATLHYGEAEFNLRRVEEPSFFADVKEKLRPLTPEEQDKAWDYYQRKFGDKFKEYSKDYKPPFGMQNPKPSSKEQQMKGLEQYWETYGKQFKNENEKYGNKFPYNQNQKEMYEKYWQIYHPGKPMPNFDQLFGDKNNPPPWSRLEAGDQSENQNQ